MEELGKKIEIISKMILEIKQDFMNLKDDSRKRNAETQTSEIANKLTEDEKAKYFEMGHSIVQKTRLIQEMDLQIARFENLKSTFSEDTFYTEMIVSMLEKRRRSEVEMEKTRSEMKNLTDDYEISMLRFFTEISDNEMSNKIEDLYADYLLFEKNQITNSENGEKVLGKIVDRWSINNMDVGENKGDDSESMKIDCEENKEEGGEDDEGQDTLEIFDIDTRNEENDDNANNASDDADNGSDEADNVSDDVSVYSYRNFRRSNLRVTLTKETPSTADSNIEILDEDLRTSSVSSSSEISNTSTNTRKRKNQSRYGMSTVKHLGFVDIDDSNIDYFKKENLKNHPDAKNENEPSLQLIRVNSRTITKAFKLGRNENLSLLTIRPKPSCENTTQRLIGNILSCKEMSNGYYYSIIRTLTIEEMIFDKTSFFHEFREPETTLFLSRFHLLPSNSLRIFNIKPISRSTSYNSALNIMINEKNNLYLSFVRHAGVKVNGIRKNPIK